jgi:hypothetical protein
MHPHGNLQVLEAWGLVMMNSFYDFLTAHWQLNPGTTPAGPIMVMMRGGSIPAADWFQVQRQIARQSAVPTHVAYSRSQIQRHV